MKTWDIFCRVIDNFGDIGVCWRLARQLVEDHQQSVRLWVDDLDSLIRIWPETQPQDQQEIAGVKVCRWHTQFANDVIVADVVIEAFACDIPAVYLNAMAKLKLNGQMPIWINLDYLSAESWVEECHRMPSAHPATGMRKTFFFPGFTSRTGGLLREKSLIASRDAFQAKQWLETIQVNPDSDALVISLFAYENPSIASLLAAWVNSSKQVHCLVPGSKILTSINQAIGQNLEVGNIHNRGNLCLQVIPFLTQSEYDKLLWACDINFVRGEDSFVRAQWAAKPMVWHIYPQDDEAHIAKLDAFLDRYSSHAPMPLATALRHSWFSWNESDDMHAGWQQLMVEMDNWQKHSRYWCNLLLEQPDLASQLIDYCATRQA